MLLLSCCCSLLLLPTMAAHEADDVPPELRIYPQALVKLLPQLSLLPCHKCCCHRRIAQSNIRGMPQELLLDLEAHTGMKSGKLSGKPGNRHLDPNISASHCKSKSLGLLASLCRAVPC